MEWNPFGVKLELSASTGTVTRISATQFTVNITASWQTYYDGAKTNYGMTVASGGVTKTLNPFGTKASSGSATFTGTYSISGNAAATKSVSFTFKNFNTDNGDNATKSFSMPVKVPALTSYTVSYSANGGAGAPSSQTKWKDQALTLSSTKPTRTGYSFQGWATSASGVVAYAPGASYKTNAAVTLYAVWKVATYTVIYSANGGSGAPTSQTKTYDVPLSLSNTTPTRTGYTFKGWGTSASSTTVAYGRWDTYTTNADIILYAIWELTYRKPRITNLSAVRCGPTGTPRNDGVFALVSFDWACDEPVSEIGIESAGAFPTSVLVSGVTGTSGTVSRPFGGGTFSTTSSYTIKVTVTDSGGSSSLQTTLNSRLFTLYGKPGGDGISFGKTSELGAADSLGGVGVAEFEFDGKFNQPVYGKALGMDRLPAIPENSDFNDYLEPGCYAVYSNAVADTIANIPIWQAGRLEVWSATGEGVRAEQWSYLRQRYIPYNRLFPVRERDIVRGEDNVWNYYAWWSSSLTPAAAATVYAKAAITVSLSANVTLGALNTYTQVPFNTTAATTPSEQLRLRDGFVSVDTKDISYVKVSGQLLIKSGSISGNRHARIQKVSDGVTTSHAWICIPAAASSNALYSFSPVVIPVKDGDLLKIVYYTGDTNDQNISGSAANGPQSWFTVEGI